MLHFLNLLNLLNLLHFCLWFCLGVCFCPPALADDLLYVYQLAEKNDDTWLAAFDTFAATREAMPQARAAFFPVINGLVIQNANNSTFLDTGSYHSQVNALRLTQPVFNYNNIAVWNQAVFQVSQAKATYAAALQDLIVRTVTQYFNVLKAKDVLYYAVKSREAYKKFVNETTTRFNAGLITITDVDIAKAQYDSALSAVIIAETNLQNQIDLLNEITCVPVCSLATLKANLELSPPEPFDMQAWVNRSLEENYSLIAQRFLVKANCQGVHVNEAANFPTLDIVGRVDRGNLAIPTATRRYTVSHLGLHLNIPIYAGGINNSKIRQSVYLLDKSKKELDLLFRQTEVSTRTAFRGVVKEIENVKALKVAMVSNAAALKATNDAFEVGARTIVDVLTAQTNLISAEQSYALARYDYVIQLFQLKQSAGTLSPCDVAFANSWLAEDPKEIADALHARDAYDVKD